MPIAVLAAWLAAPAGAETGVIDDHALFPEGPVMAGSTLVYAQYAGNEVTAWDGKARRTLWRQEGCGPSAVIPFGADWLVTCYDSGTLAVISQAGETLRVIDADAGGGALQGPNDGAPDGRGGAYVSLSGPWEAGPIVGRIVHVTPDGVARPVADDLHYANGVAFGPDGRLYVNESEAGRVISFAVGADGGLEDRRLFIRLYRMGEDAGAYPDGIKLGPNGNFFVGQYSSGRILEVAPDGTLVRVHDTGATAAPNLTFAPDGRVMYVMAVDNTAGAPYEGRVLAVPLGD
ncbi:MAG: SMP-30/gluconolactonase/LRE family protein [Rhodobacteraceae bacterium]|nr:SMP-30/gluconolactonase/LRE family protein [Paracoccaceae bacterium]